MGKLLTHMDLLYVQAV